jgi:hypothetical protein
MLAPQRVWPFASGYGVTVAVLGSGVDAGVPGLRGRVEPGFDAYAGTGGAATDCTGTGTAVAGEIAARSDDDHGIVGLAPDATILPVRVTGNGDVPPDALAAGITWAADRHAGVIDVTVSVYTDSPALRAAVAHALGAGAVVVAAAGDRGTIDGSPPPVPYPAALDGVLAVGVVDPSGMRWVGSPAGRYVSLVAPGMDVPCLQPGGGTAALGGSALASGFVAGAAALARSRNPDAGVDDVVHQLTGTATPVGGGADSPGYGYGLVDPYGAVTTSLVPSSPVPLPALARRTGTAPTPRPETLVLLGLLASALMVVAGLVGAAALPRARRRGWRPALSATLVPRPEPADPGPPLPLFDDDSR